MKTLTKIIAGAALTLGLATALVACSGQSDTVSYNLSKDADSFKINRLIVFHNDITDTNMFSIEGLCALGNDDTDDKRTVICKIGKDSYVKEIIQMGDNVSVLSVQTQPSKSDPFHYTVIFAPEKIIPNIDLQGSGIPEEPVDGEGE